MSMQMPAPYASKRSGFADSQDTAPKSPPKEPSMYFSGGAKIGSNTVSESL